MSSHVKRDDIQGLRAIAILMVICFHFYPNFFPNGYVGVDMFFVISGYLICMILSRNEYLTLELVKTFYKRRAKRILPLYYFVILCTLLIVVIIVPREVAEENPLHALKAIFLVTNIKTAEEDSYEMATRGGQNFFSHTWSLCAEMQFYILVPFIMMLAQREICGISRNVTYGLVAIGSLILFCTLNYDTAFNLTLARMWQFMSGFYAYNYSSKEEDIVAILGEKEEEKPKRATVLSYISLLLLFSGLLFFPINSLIIRLIVTSATGIIIQQGVWGQLSVLTNSVCLTIGDASYSIYLIHWPVYCAGKVFLPTNLASESTEHIELALFASIFVGLLVYYYIEKAYLSWEYSTVFKIISGFAFASTMIIGGYYAFYAYNQNHHLPPVLKKALEYNNFYSKGTSAIDANESNSFQYTNYKGDIDRKRLGVAVNSTGPYRFLIIGDSYSFNQKSIIYKYFSQFSSTFWHYYNNGCEVLFDNESSSCKRVFTPYLDVAKDYKPHFIFIISRGRNMKEKIRNGLDEDDTTEDILERLEDFEEIQSVKKIFLFGAFPSVVKAGATKACQWQMEGKYLKNYESLIDHDEGPMVARMKYIQKKCKKCQLYEAIPLFLSTRKDLPDKFQAFDPENEFLYLENGAHFTSWGGKIVEKLYEKLANEFRKKYINNTVLIRGM